MVIGPTESDRVILLGDLIDRGPYPVGVVKRARERGWESILGNHDEKAARWLRYEAIHRSGGKPNPMRPIPAERRAEWESLSDEEADWLRNLPMILESDGWFFVHAGFEPGRTLDAQRKDRVIRVRYVNDKGEMVPYADGSLDQPPDTVYWTEQWKGPKNVVYGHAVHSLEAPRIDDRGGVLCVGIDTGCCFGGRLTAMIIQDGGHEFVQVPARREYMKRPGPGLSS